MKLTGAYNIFTPAAFTNNLEKHRLVKKILLPTSIVCLLVMFIALTSFKAKSNKSTNTAATVKTEETATVKAAAMTAEVVSNKIYDSLELDELGLPRDVLTMAYKGQQQLAEQGVLENEDIIFVHDFSQSSSKKRLYNIDTNNYRILYNTYVAHGKNTGLNYAERFSNIPESLQSSLGFYKTKGTYFGKHGLSLKLEGL